MAVFLTKRKLHFPISIFSMLELSDELSTYFRPSSVCIPRADWHDNDVTAHKTLCTPLREIGSGDDLEEDRQSGFFFGTLELDHRRTPASRALHPSWLAARQINHFREA